MPMTAAADDASDGNNAASMPAVLSASQARAAVAGSGLTPAWLTSRARQSAETAVNAEASPTATDEEPLESEHRGRTSSAEPPAGGTLPPTPGDYGLAAWRACFYVLMYFHWRNSEVHALPAYEPKMFGYDQFWWVPQLMPQDPAAVEAYATQASNPRRAGRVPGRSATHTCEPCLGQVPRAGRPAGAARRCGGGLPAELGRVPR